MVMAVLASLGGSIGNAGGAWLGGPDPMLQVGVERAGDLSLLTYNVHALPWPLARGREAALATIEQRLVAMRRAGEQPHIVVLQEVFTDRAQQIGANAGYRYRIAGASRDLTGGMATNEAVRDIAAEARWIKGERSGRMLGSGLQILSDYPVLSVRRAAFPDGACAGYDCLANKGALLVTLRVPGRVQPLTVVTAHMNAKKASGVSEARSFAAYREQARLLGAFVRAHRDPRSPLLLAGDLNANNDERRAELQRQLSVSLAPAPDRPAASGLAAIAARTPHWPDGLQEEAQFIEQRGRDWQFFADGLGTEIAPAALRIPFGREADGTMLSDHMGMQISYRFAPTS